MDLRWTMAYQVALLLLVTMAALPAMGASQTTTQAGCACLDTWRDAAGAQHSGCANPDGDPLGAWCAVDPQRCLGYYASFTGVDGSAVFFDYCGDVRERTTHGCLCAPEWWVEGTGKTVYRNRCAHPDSETARKCRVDHATCPSGSEVAGDFDTCGPAVTSDAPTGAATTFNNCSCIEGGWWYLYPSGAAATGPVNRTIRGCANPDGDPVGPWCAVDPERCPRFAGYVGIDPVNKWAFDYCTTLAPSLQPRSGCAPNAIAEWGQCGGKSNCSDWGCADRQWPGACCAAGLECRRQGPYYWQCVAPGAATSSAAAASADAAAAAGEAAADEAAGAAARVATPSTGGAAATVNTTGLSSLQAKVPGATIYIRLKLDYSFDALTKDVGAQARFKSDVVAWLKGAAAPVTADQIYSAGVDTISRGSVIADAQLVLVSDVTADGAAAAAQRLQSTAGTVYSGSALQTNWGPLVGLEAATSKGALTGALAPAAGAATLSAGPAPGQPGGDGGRVQLSAGAYAGIAVSCAAVVAALGFVVYRGLRINAEQDTDKSAQLAYINEMTEADIAAAEGEGAAAGADTEAGMGAGGGGSQTSRIEAKLARVLIGPTGAEAAITVFKLPTSKGAARLMRSTDGAGESELDSPGIAAAPDPAFLPPPESEAGERRSSGGDSGAPSSLGGIVYASLKQRHTSSAGVATGSATPASAVSTPTVARAQGATGSGAFFVSTLSKLGSSVAGYVSGSGAVEPPAPRKDQ